MWRKGTVLEVTWRWTRGTHVGHATHSLDCQPSAALEIVTFQSEDHREALAAIREKRKPVFKGR